MDGVADFTTVGTDAEPMLGCHRDAIALQVAFLLAIHHFIIGQVQQRGPKREGGSCHGSPSSAGDLRRSLISPTVHSTRITARFPQASRRTKLTSWMPWSSTRKPALRVKIPGLPEKET